VKCTSSLFDEAVQAESREALELLADVAPTVCQAAIELQLHFEESSICGGWCGTCEKVALLMKVLERRATAFEGVCQQQIDIAGSFLKAQQPLEQAAVLGRCQQTEGVQGACHIDGPAHAGSNGFSSSASSNDRGTALQEVQRKLANLEQLEDGRAFTTELFVEGRADLAEVTSEMATCEQLSQRTCLLAQLRVQKLISAIRELKQLAHKTRLFVEQEDPDGWGPLVGYAATP